MGSREIWAQCKSEELDVGRERERLSRALTTLRRSLVHRDIKPSNVIVVNPSNSSWFSFFSSGAIRPPFSVVQVPFPGFHSINDGSSSANVRARALGRALSVTRLGSNVRLVLTACNLVKILKKALRISALFCKRVFIGTYKFSRIDHWLFEYGWGKTHGPRPPSFELKWLLRCFQQVNGCVHSPVAM
jgi:serine/threonine protein kinase